MPTRLLREGILESERIDQLDLGAEVFYRRLMSRVDDHGLYTANLSILRAHLYPLRLDRVREADIARWIATCEKAGVIVLYEAGGKPYLKMLDTNWQIRSNPKYPLPPDSSCKQLLSAVHLDVVEDEVVIDKSDFNSDFESLWEKFGKFGAKGSKKKALDQFKKLKPDKELISTMLTAVDNQIAEKSAKTGAGKFAESHPHVERWLRERRWEDEIDDVQPRIVSRAHEI